MGPTATPEDSRPLLTPAEVAELANVSRKTVYREIDRGALLAAHVGRQRQIDPTDFRLYLDRGGDRIVPGAFTKTLAQWRASGDPVPVIWSREWQAPDSHIGVAYANDMVETDRGLLVKKGKLDIDDNPVAARVHKLMARRSVKEFSFGYSVAPGGERKASDGANELLELDLVEIGPTLKGLNPATELRSVKSLTQTTIDDDDAAIRNWARDETYALLTHDSGEIGTLEERLDKRVARAEMRQLRRQCDRMRLEEALGWDTDLISSLTG